MERGRVQDGTGEKRQTGDSRDDGTREDQFSGSLSKTQPKDEPSKPATVLGTDVRIEHLPAADPLGAPLEPFSVQLSEVLFGNEA